jgi:hypothetical protein
MRTEDERAGRLLDAQANAVALFDEVVARGIIAAGRGEQAASDQIRDLANEMFGKTRAQLYAEIARLAREVGWSLGGTHAGHLVGEFPHETIDGDRIESYIAPGNTTPMRRQDKAGRVCHWILEIHLTDTARGFGGFYEQLLDLG